MRKLLDQMNLKFIVLSQEVDDFSNNVTVNAHLNHLFMSLFSVFCVYNVIQKMTEPAVIIEIWLIIQFDLDVQLLLIIKVLALSILEIKLFHFQVFIAETENTDLVQNKQSLNNLFNCECWWRLKMLELRNVRWWRWHWRLKHEMTVQIKSNVLWDDTFFSCSKM